MARLSFKYPGVAFGAALDKDVNERNVLLGELNSVDQLPQDLRWEAGAALPIPCRSSVVRIVWMKLFGTCVLAVVVGCAHSSNAEVALSCGLAAAVNAVAIAHYYFICTSHASNPLHAPVG